MALVPIALQAENQLSIKLIDAKAAPDGRSYLLVAIEPEDPQ